MNPAAGWTVMAAVVVLGGALRFFTDITDLDGPHRPAD
jgi:hypothetical protein